ncbi:MAG: glycoside hydrolase family 95 protein [Kiritimatiellae bacterium]|nr:glycoside hydrolase family 95 protein [Kiritimatiellia bacterium]
MRFLFLSLLVTAGSAFAQLPLNRNLPVSFGVNSKLHERLEGEFLDARIYARVWSPREIMHYSKSKDAAVSGDKLVWRGVPKVGDTCDAARRADYAGGFTFAAYVKPKGAGRLLDNVTPGRGDGWLIDFYQAKLRLVLGGGTNYFHPQPVEWGTPHSVVVTVAADGAWALWLDGKRHEETRKAERKSRGWELLYDRPADNWNAALPVGNGRLGAMVFGGIDQERLQLNEETIWSGNPGPNDDPGATPENFRKSREFVFAGQGAEAMKALPRDYTRSAKYQPFGDLIVKFALPEGEVSDYVRTLSLDDAVATTSFMKDGVLFTRETFASFTDDVVVFRVSASEPGEVNFDATFAKHWAGECVEENGQLVFGATTGAAPGGKPGNQLRFEGRLAVKTEGGSVICKDGRITVKGADAAVLLVGIATNFKRFDDLSGDAHAKCVSTLAKALAVPYEKSRAAHAAFYRSLADRCTLWLGRDAYAGTTTELRLKNFRETGDTYLPALYFRFGRYLMISGSQPGTQPTNLQGIWNEHMDPPWNANYTININTEMNYWPAESTGLGMLAEPLWRMCDELAVTGARTARTVYGAAGWTAHHNTDLWRIAGPAGPTGCGTWPSGGAWLSMHLWYHWLYTHDRAFLASHYATLKGAADFYVSYLVKDPATGRLTVCPSISPENRPNGKFWNGSLTHGATMDHAIARDILNAAADATDILGKDAAYAKKLRTVAAEIEPYHVGRWGQLQEWSEDFDNPSDTHRHTSHLYGLYPSAQITPETPELFKAARVSLEHRGDFSTGWAMGWRVCLWARLLDGNHAYTLLQNQLRLVGSYAGVNYGKGGGTYLNLFDAHPPFQIDGNFGCAAGIAEMLLQSHRGALDLLPALPDAWPEGRVTGLRGQGGFVVEIVWMEGKPVFAKIRSELGEPCTVRYAGKARKLALKRGETAVVTEF